MLILITGAKQVGKDTLASFIIKWRPDFQQYALAGNLKKLTADIFGVSQYDVDEMKLREGSIVACGLSMRQLLQNIGQGVRKLDPNFWCRSIPIDTVENIVVSDLRLPAEYEYFKQNYKGKMIVIKIIKQIQSEDRHITEQGWKQIQSDITLVNEFDGLDRFEAKARGIIDI